MELRCIGGFVGARFWRGRRMCEIKYLFMLQGCNSLLNYINLMNDFICFGAGLIHIGLILRCSSFKWNLTAHTPVKQHVRGWWDVANDMSTTFLSETLFTNRLTSLTYKQLSLLYCVNAQRRRFTDVISQQEPLTVCVLEGREAAGFHFKQTKPQVSPCCFYFNALKSFWAS